MPAARERENDVGNRIFHAQDPPRVIVTQMRLQPATKR
jgi:hypothetical protein